MDESDLGIQMLTLLLKQKNTVQGLQAEMVSTQRTYEVANVQGEVLQDYCLARGWLRDGEAPHSAIERLEYGEVISPGAPPPTVQSALENIREAYGKPKPPAAEVEVTPTEVRLLRARKDWTLQDLANRSGINKAYLSEYENGKRQLTQEQLQTIAALDVRHPYVDRLSDEHCRQFVERAWDWMFIQADGGVARINLDAEFDDEWAAEACDFFKARGALPEVGTDTLPLSELPEATWEI